MRPGNIGVGTLGHIGREISGDRLEAGLAAVAADRRPSESRWRSAWTPSEPRSRASPRSVRARPRHTSPTGDPAGPPAPDEIRRRDDLGVIVADTRLCRGAARRRPRRPRPLRRTARRRPPGPVPASLRRRDPRRRVAAASNRLPDRAASPGRPGPRRARPPGGRAPSGAIDDEGRLVIAQVVPRSRSMGSSGRRRRSVTTIDPFRIGLAGRPIMEIARAPKQGMSCGSCVSAAQRRDIRRGARVAGAHDPAQLRGLVAQPVSASSASRVGRCVAIARASTAPVRLLAASARGTIR